MNTFLGPQIKLIGCGSQLVYLCGCHIAIAADCGKLKIYNIVMVSYSTTFIPSFVKIDQMVQNLKKGTHARAIVFSKAYLPLTIRNKVPYRTELTSINGTERKHLGYYKVVIQDQFCTQWYLPVISVSNPALDMNIGLTPCSLVAITEVK
jgi:hypothetical protein